MGNNSIAQATTEVKLQPGNALNEYYGAPELFGRNIALLGFSYDLDFSVPTCPFCGAAKTDGYIGPYDGFHRMGLIVCRTCARIIDAY